MTTTETRTRGFLRILRFDRVQLVTHWVTAAMFGVLMATAIPLYFGSFFGVVLPRLLIERIHLWTGLALPLPVIISLVGSWGRRMRRDLRMVSYWTRDEIMWFKTLGKSGVSADKFNPGQKLNTLFVASAIVVLLATGSMLQWFRFFSVPLRAGATFVHDAFALVVFVVVVGHVLMAFTHREPLRAIFTGWVSEQWAKVHAATWLEEQRSPREAGEPAAPR
jgi:formate dehydrogenase subunit gamma